MKNNLFLFFLDITIFIVSFVWLCWMPKEVPPLSVAQILMLLRCFRPLRIFILVPHMKRVVTELCKSFKEIILVSVLLIVLIFIFANWGVHLFGLRFASCNDKSITSRYVKYNFLKSRRKGSPTSRSYFLLLIFIIPNLFAYLVSDFS